MGQAPVPQLSYVVARWASLEFDLELTRKLLQHCLTATRPPFVRTIAGCNETTGSDITTLRFSRDLVWPESDVPWIGLPRQYSDPPGRTKADR
jgi:hypothetical protein